MKTLIIAMIMMLGLGAQTPNPNDQMVTVPKSWVDPSRQFQVQPAQITQYIGIGKEVGEAVKNGLESVVDVSNKVDLVLFCTETVPGSLDQTLGRWQTTKCF